MPGTKKKKALASQSAAFNMGGKRGEDTRGLPAQFFPGCRIHLGDGRRINKGEEALKTLGGR